MTRHTSPLVAPILDQIDRSETDPRKIEASVIEVLRDLGVWNARSQVVVNSREIDIACATGTFQIRLPEGMTVRETVAHADPFGLAIEAA